LIASVFTRCRHPLLETGGQPSKVLAAGHPVGRLAGETIERYIRGRPVRVVCRAGGRGGDGQPYESERREQRAWRGMVRGMK
jgi:hypothetical protein